MLEIVGTGSKGGNTIAGHVLATLGVLVEDSPVRVIESDRSYS